MPSATLTSIDLARRRSMALAEKGDLMAAEAELTRLIASSEPAGDVQSRQLLYHLYQDRSTVRRRANFWDKALADLSAAERLVDGLPVLFQATLRSSIAHARAKILVAPGNPCANRDEALVQLGTMREAGTPELAAAADNLESSLASDAGEWMRAASLARRCAKTLDDSGWPGAAATNRICAAEALIEAGDLAGAEVELRAARGHIDRFGTPPTIASAGFVHGRLLSARSSHDEAWERTVAALDVFDGLIRRFPVLSEQQTFLIDKLGRYDQAFAIALKSGGDRGCLRAWSVAERSKSFYLCQLLAGADVTLFEGVDPADLRALREAGEEIDGAERAYGHLSAGDQGGRPGLDLVARLHDASKRKTELLQRLMRTNPRWARVTVPTGLDMSEQIQRLPDGWSLLSYYWEQRGYGTRRGHEPGRLHLFWTDGARSPHHAVTEWTPGELQSLRATRVKLQGKVPIRDEELIPKALSGRILPPEVCRQIPENSRLLISPHGLLQLLPLHALGLETGGIAAGRWAMQYLPTLSLLPLTHNGERKDPVLLIGCEQDGFGDGPLTEIPDEVRSLGDVWSAPPARPVTPRLIPTDGSPDDEHVGIGTWGGFGIVHVACHGDFPADRPFDAGLRLGSASIRTSDFFGVRLDGVVATFSACAVARHAESLEGRAVVGDEWIGLYLPLLYAGAHCVVASLWDAYSNQAAVFMKFLHVALRRGDDPADAMRWAQDRAASEFPSDAMWANWYPVGLPIAAPERH